MTSINEDTAYQLSHNWFLINGEDKLIACDVSLGLVVQLMVFEYFFQGANETWQHRGFKGFVKKKHIEWHIRFLHNFLTQRRNAPKHVELVTVYDVNNKPMIETANLVANMCNNEQVSVAGIVVDKTIHSQVSRNFDCFYLTNAYGVADEIHAKRMANKEIKKLNQFWNVYCNNIAAFEITKKETFKFLKFIKIQIPQLCREILALANLLNRLSPKAILLTSDAHRIGRIIVQIAKKLKITTYVVQHGAPIWRYGYTPVIADKMLIWGEDALDWFSNHGVSAEKLSIVGNPRFDNLSMGDPKKNNDHLPKLLLLPNPIDRALISDMISSFISVAISHDGPIIIKLHPSETDLDWFKGQVPKNLKTKIEVSTKPLGKIGIGLGDVAVVANSTAGADVILLGGAIINVELPGMPNPIPYNKYKVGVSTVLDNLGASIIKVKNFDKKKWIVNRKLFLEKFLYRLDGKSAKRAASIIMDGVVEKM